MVTPGITIRDRLRVLLPSEKVNYYRERDLVPPDLWGALHEAQVFITNYHTFLLKDAKEIQGVASNTRKILVAGKEVDPFKETPADMVARVLREFASRGRGELVVFNDEAHHCYQDKPLTQDEDLAAEDRKEAAERNEGARVWFRGVQAVKQKVGIKVVYDLSATPFYLKGSGYNEGFIFPWVVSDFSLMDAIESGIVKVPRIPVDDDAVNPAVVYLRLWDAIGQRLPKRRSKSNDAAGDWVPPDTLEAALKSLHGSYAASFERWERQLAPLGEPPPVFIVVCPNTVVSKLVYEWAAGVAVEQPDGSTRLRPGQLDLLSNVEDNRWLPRPRTILVDSAQLESGEALSADFKAAASLEIDSFKAEYRRRNAGADVDKLTDEDLLREVLNTVGKKGKLGEHVRCVVSVQMLTEGWDANTVTHILGIRRFGSQLLCEQVVGRGLRRRSYAVNEDGRFEAEYAEVYGVPFAFIPSDKPVGNDKPPSPAIEVRALEERSELRITFPKLDGYRLELADESFYTDFDDESAKLHVDKTTVALWTQSSGIVGAAAEQHLDELRDVRPQQGAYEIAKTLVATKYTAKDAVQKPWLFPQLASIAQEWLRTCVTFEPDCDAGLLLLADGTNRAAEALFNAVLKQQDNRREVLRPLLRRFDNEGSTDDVHFFTRKAAIPTERSPVSHVVLDGPSGGNTWEETVALLLEGHPDVVAYVKNDHLGFTIPYLHAGVHHQYVPDFLIRLRERSDEVARTLVVEVSGGRKSPGPTKAKATTARYQWCASVNNHGGWGRWGYTEISDMTLAASGLNNAIANLYADGFTTGLAEAPEIP